MKSYQYDWACIDTYAIIVPWLKFVVVLFQKQYVSYVQLSCFHEHVMDVMDNDDLQVEHW